MTTQDYAEAYEGDSENVRSWAPQDAQEPPSDVEREFALEGDPKNTLLRTLRGKAADHLERIVAERDAYRKAKQENDERFQLEAAGFRQERDVALAAITRVEKLATHWEQCGTRYISIPEAAAQLLQALDEAALEYPREPVG
jgi:hypothetical protein